MSFTTSTTRAAKIKIIFICVFVLPVAYYAYRVVDNYFYLQRHYFNTNIKYTDTTNFSDKVIVQNTMTSAPDTVDLAASNLILVFSATWCKPCLEEIPLITKLYRSQQAYHFRLYFILDEKNAIINRFSKKNKLAFETYTIISRRPSQLNCTVYPTTIVCRNGKSDLKIDGQLTEADTAMIYKKFRD